MQYFVINLKRRPDRLASFLSNAPDIPWRVIEAVDGELLIPDVNILRFCNNNSYEWRRGVIACALSHMSIYETMIEEKIEVALIAEDDMHFIGEPDLDAIVAELHDWDICMLGHHEINGGFKHTTTFKATSKECYDASIGGMFCMLVSLRGAVRFLDYLVRSGLHYPIDTELMSVCDSLDVYYIVPPVARSLCTYNVADADSDIQHSLHNINISSMHKVAILIRHYEGKRVGMRGDPADYDVFISTTPSENAYRIDDLYITEGI